MGERLSAEDRATELSSEEKRALDEARRADYCRGWSGSWPDMDTEILVIEAVITAHVAAAVAEERERIAKAIESERVRWSGPGSGTARSALTDAARIARGGDQ